MCFSSLLVEPLPCTFPLAGVHAVTLMALIAIYLGCGFRGIAVEHRTSSIQLLGSVLRAAQSSKVLLFCMTWERHVSLGSV